ncbi:MAG: hypothetical protein AMXMBFR48_22650 [Ignavibacteriales bacterium]
MKTTIRIQNFKSLEDVTLELAPTTVFLGPNGAGKSSVLKCLEFVSKNIKTVIPAKPQDTKYKLQNSVDLGKYADIVYQNDLTRDIIVEINHKSSFKNYDSNFFYEGWISIGDDKNKSWLEGIDLNCFSAKEKNKLLSLFDKKETTLHFVKEHSNTLDFNASVRFSYMSSKINLKEICVFENELKSSLKITFSKTSKGAIKGSFQIILEGKILNESFGEKNYIFEWMFYGLRKDKQENLLRNLVVSINENNSLNNDLSIQPTLNVLNVCAAVLKLFEYTPKVLSKVLNVKHLPSVREGVNRIYKSEKNKALTKNSYYFKDIIDKKEIEVHQLWWKVGELTNGFRKKLNYSTIDADLAQNIRLHAKEINDYNWDQGFAYNGIIYWLQKLSLAEFVYKELEGMQTKIFVKSLNGSIFPFQQSSSGLIQTFPIIASVYESYNFEKDYILVEQPELHIHPKLQFQLAELLSGKKSHPWLNTRFIIETHSEHLIRGYQLLIAQGKIKPRQIRFYYFNPVDNKTEVINLKVDKLGNFITPWPNGFFSEASDLSYKLLEEQLKRQK